MGKPARRRRGWRSHTVRSAAPRFLDRDATSGSAVPVQVRLEGFNLGQRVSISEDMQTRCEERLGRRTPLVWHEYVKAAALGVGIDELPDDSEMTDEQHRRTIAALRSELMDALGIEEVSDA
jgi:hypothetical protein